jgi:hypothetical protein
LKLIFRLIFFAFLTTACGGTWENDDDSWEKTFGEEKPIDIELINSYFWKSSHWTYEYEVYMEIKYNQKWLLKMINQYEMEATTIFSMNQIGLVNEKPSWFAPKTADDYVLLESNKFKEAKILIDKKTSTLYFTFNQL